MNIRLHQLLLFVFSTLQLLTQAQVSITSSQLVVTDSFNGFTGSNTLSNWDFQGTGARGTTWNTTNQTSSSSGGWYANNNISFLGSSSASNGNATWILQNNTGAVITKFKLSFLAQLFKNGTNSPVVTVSYSSAPSLSMPNAGILSNTIPALYFSDTTNNISNGTTFSHDISNVNIPNGHYIYIRFIHPGGSNSDNLGWDNLFFSATLNTGTCAPPFNLTTNNTSSTGSNLNWQAPTGINHFEYALTQNSTPPTNATQTNDTFFSAATLNTAQTYYFHVRSNCGSGNYSPWQSVSFKTSVASSDIKLMSYNLLNYPGSTATTRDPDFRIVINAYNPDILVAQEISQASGASLFLNNVLNHTSSTYNLGTFIDGPDSDNALFYKSNAFHFLSNKSIKTALRDINQFSLIHLSSGDTLTIFSVHLKASSGAANEAARAAEVDSLRKITNSGLAGKYFMVCGDFNFYYAEDAYIKLVSARDFLDGKFNDVITMAQGSWNNSVNAIHHTQSPRGGSFGGLDDRFDMILFSNEIINPGGFDVVTSTYKAFGNDGQHYNQDLSTPPYIMYNQTLVTALTNASDHIPVVVTLTHGNVLPIKLKNIRIKKTSSYQHQLQWETFTEKNTKHFIIEASSDLYDYQIIDSVAASGNSNTIKLYGFTLPEQVVKQYTNYRLRIVDYDGKITYSPVVNYTSFEQSSIQIFPNPVTNTLNIYDGELHDDLSFTITNMHGQHINCPVKKDENGLYQIDTSMMNNSVYVLSIKGKNAPTTFRFLKQ